MVEETVSVWHCLYCSNEFRITSKCAAICPYCNSTSLERIETFTTEDDS
jgi:DNA-directed RNA polymerase subunit RPC12/RpoP